MKMKWRAFSKLGKDFFSVLLIFSFLSSCFVKSKFDNPTDGVGGLLLEGLSVLYAVSEANITVSGVLKDSAGSVVPSGILDISRSGSTNSLQRASADSRVYSDANGKFSMNVYQGSFTVKVSRADGTSVGSFSIKISSATATPEVLSSTGLQVSGLSAAPVGTGSGGSDPLISVSNTPSSIEEGTSVSIGIKLAGSITQSYTLSITSSNSSSLSVSPSTLTFTSSNFSIEQKVTLSALQDENLISESIVITLSSTGLSNVELKLNTVDDDTQNIIIAGVTQLNEGSSGNVTVKLSKEPSSNVSVSLVSSVATSLSLTTSTLVFTSLNYSIPQTITVNALQDANQNSETVVISATATGIVTATWNIVCIEDDTTIVFGAPTGSEGNTVTVPIILSGNPGASRTVSFSSNNNPPTVSPSSMTFTTSNFSISQTLTLTGLTDSNTTSIITAQESNQSSSTKLVTKTWNATTAKYSIGGTVSGLTGNLVLTNKGTYDTTTVSANGNFSFSKAASTYVVAAKLYLLGKVCLFSKTTGIANSDIINIGITCTSSYTIGEEASGLLSTGQTTSYQTGDDGTYQGTLKRYYTDNGNGTVTDNVTGLIWQKCSRGQNNDSTCSGIASQTEWANAGNYCSSLTLATKTWRLPTLKELRGIVDYGKANPTIDITVFPGTQSSVYWSSSTFAQETNNASYVHFYFGSVSYSSKSANLNYVRCATGP